MMCGICKIVATMKKIMNIFVLVAAAAMTLVSCQKNEFETPAQKELHFTVKAGVPQTKTSITDNGDKTYTPSWAKGDKIGVFFADPAKDENLTTTFENTAGAGIVATFEGKASATDEGTLYSFYPSSAFGKAYGDGTIRLDLATSQKPTSTSFDPACDILVAQPCMYMSDGTEVLVDDMHFARIMSVLKISLNTTFTDIEDEVVESISFGVAGVDIAGNAVVDYKTAEIKGWNNGSTDRNVLTATYNEEEGRTIAFAGANKTAYFVVAPVTIPAGKTLTFTIKTKNYDIVKTVTSPEMSFTAGKVEVINLTIAEDNCTAVDTSVDFSGEYLMTGIKSGAMAAALKWDGSANNLKPFAVTKLGDQIVETSGIENCKMTITKVTSGTYKGMYTIEDASSTSTKRSYLYAAGGSGGNHLKASSTLSASSYWDITLNDKGTYTITATKHSYDRNTIWYNTNNNIFSCYQLSSTSYAAITLYPYSMVKPDMTPKIEVTETKKSIGADGGNVTFAYTLKNLDGENVTATVSDEDMLSATASNGTLTVTVSENEDEARSATVTLSCGDADDVVFTIEQAAAATGGAAPSGTILWKETWGSYTGTVANYKFAGTTVYGGSTSGLSYKVDNTNDQIESTTAGSVTSNNLFFYKSAASSWTVDGINLAGATSVTLKYTINRTNVAVYYSVDGGAEKQLCASSTSGTNTKTISNLSGSTLKLRFNKTGTSQNCRIDDISVTVN